MCYHDMEKRKARCEARNKRLAESAVEMKELRIRLGVTQSQLARKTGVTVNSGVRAPLARSFSTTVTEK